MLTKTSIKVMRIETMIIIIITIIKIVSMQVIIRMSTIQTFPLKVVSTNNT
jgi:hypothetical protein